MPRPIGGGSAHDSAVPLRQTSSLLYTSMASSPPHRSAWLVRGARARARVSSASSPLPPCSCTRSRTGCCPVPSCPAPTPVPICSPLGQFCHRTPLRRLCKMSLSPHGDVTGTRNVGLRQSVHSLPSCRGRSPHDSPLRSPCRPTRDRRPSPVHPSDSARTAVSVITCRTLSRRASSPEAPFHRAPQGWYVPWAVMQTSGVVHTLLRDSRRT